MLAFKVFITNSVFDLPISTIKAKSSITKIERADYDALNTVTTLRYHRLTN